MVVGCDTQAFVHFKEGAAGCLTYSTSSKALRESGCKGLGSRWGLGCCTSEIPNGLKSLEANISRFANYANSLASDHCGFAFLASGYSYDFPPSDLDDRKLADADVPIELDWSIGNQTYDEAERNSARGYACPSNNSRCYGRYEGRVGYLCRCSSYNGNPYLESGCEGIATAGSTTTCLYFTHIAQT
ncbi:unnamed protein product [Spirodela intermedia]|uniref:Uncharacterized protein n=1 Tax=Spirodela intermedia TaxID=51605 RepID=A0A7I8K6C0_SPIIN|nr:unnamed protein product [Spirodela intermedia]